MIEKKMPGRQFTKYEEQWIKYVKEYDYPDKEFNIMHLISASHVVFDLLKQQEADLMQEITEKIMQPLPFECSYDHDYKVKAIRKELLMRLGLNKK